VPFDTVGEFPLASNFSKDHPLLLITDYAPDLEGGGGVILRSLLGAPERERIAWLTLSRPEGPETDGVVFLRRGSAGRGSGRRRSLLLDSTVLARPLVQEVRSIARERDARAIWAVMHGAVVPMASHLARSGALPVHLTVHDDPAFGVAMRSRRYVALAPWIEHHFASAMRRAASVDVICEGMAERYRRRYGVSPVIVHRGMASEVEPAPRHDRGRGIVVGILGYTYSYRQLPILGRARALSARRLGQKGRLVVIGRGYGERLRDELAGDPDVDVEVTGHLDEAEAVRRLRDCFLLYLNYPFSNRDAVLRQTSFPTKLSTFVMAARPILMHAPADSSVAPLGEYGGYVLSWQDSEAEVGAERIARAWSDPHGDESYHHVAEQVRRKYYDFSRNQRTLLGALDALAGPPGP
jgi:hypothetical protein